MQKQNPLLRIWGWGKDEHGGLIFAIVSALIGVALGMLPYYAAAQIIIGMLSGERSLSLYLPWLGLGLAGYAARTLLYNMALSVSHKATFSILKTIRQRILEKLPKLPLGTVMDMQSGKMKQIIVDQVDGMETTLAHLFPELTANIGGPVLIIIYLFVLDWRMALLSLVTIPVGMVFMMSVMGNYSRDYEGAVKTTQEMNGTVVEYINGIEVIKAFNQGKSSYAKLTDRVKANASYYYNWMKKSQFGTASGYAVVPATLITILPAGWMWYTGGSLPMETFITVIILSLGIAGPLLAAMNFVDTLAIVGTTVASVDELLSAEEQQHGEKEVRIKSTDMKGFQPMVGFNYGAKNYSRMQEAIKSCMKWTTVFCIVFTIVIFAFATPIMSLFSDDPQVLGIAVPALRANTIMFFTFGLQYTCSTLYLAMGKALVGGILNICRQGIMFIPVILVLPTIWNLNGVIYAQAVADLLTTFVTIFFAVRILRQLKQVQAQNA